MPTAHYYMLIADNAIAEGSSILNHDAEGRPFAAHQNPRSVSIADAFEGRIHSGLPDIVAGRVSQAARLLRVTPRGPVSPHPAYLDPGAEVDEHIPLQADGGWTVEAVDALPVIFGPQGELVLAAVRAGITHLVDDEDGDVARVYSQEVDRLHAAGHDVDGLRDAAEAALWEIKADGFWWAKCAFGCTWGDEMLALVARDLIGFGAGRWTQHAYDVLTRPWRIALPETPLHPADQPLTAAPALVHS